MGRLLFIAFVLAPAAVVALLASFALTLVVAIAVSMTVVGAIVGIPIGAVVGLPLWATYAFLPWSLLPWYIVCLAGLILQEEEKPASIKA